MDDPWATPWTSTDQSVGTHQPDSFGGQNIASSSQQQRSGDRNTRHFSVTSWEGDVDADFGDWAATDVKGKPAIALNRWTDSVAAQSTSRKQSIPSSQYSSYSPEDDTSPTENMPQNPQYFEQVDKRDNYADTFSEYLDPWKADPDPGEASYNEITPSRDYISQVAQDSEYMQQYGVTVIGTGELSDPDARTDFSGKSDQSREHSIRDEALKHQPYTTPVSSGDGNNKYNQNVSQPDVQNYLTPPSATNAEILSTSSREPLKPQAYAGAANNCTAPEHTHPDKPTETEKSVKTSAPPPLSAFAELTQVVLTRDLTPTAQVGGKEDVNLSSNIIQDCFANIPERKAWYRVSRRESSRRYNSGNDNNYSPVCWGASSVRMEVLKIVRRWLEEDSLAGGPTLGGSGIKGNAFGWDSAAEPVALDVVYNKKRASLVPSNSLAYSRTQRPPEHRDGLLMKGLSGTVLYLDNAPRILEKGNASISDDIDVTAAQENTEKAVVCQGHSNLDICSNFSLYADKHCHPSTDTTKVVQDSSEDDDWGDMVSPTSELGESLPGVPVGKSGDHNSPSLLKQSAGGLIGAEAYSDLDNDGGHLNCQSRDLDNRSLGEVLPVVADGTAQPSEPSDKGQGSLLEDMSVQAILRGLPDLTYMDR